jgi:YHYH protein
MKRRFLQLAATLFILITTIHFLDLDRLTIAPSAANVHQSDIPIGKLPSGKLNLKKLPIGDGKLATSPKAGWIWPCRVGGNHIGGAHRKGPWIKDEGTYDLTAKAIVNGTVNWSQRFKMAVEGENRVFTTNDLPNHPTGIYPIDPTKNADAYKYDRNPNRISSQNMRVELPLEPQLAAEPICTPGAIGILNSGSVLFNALDAPGRDALAHEIQDTCQGHPEPTGVYHYHSISTCLPDKTARNGHSEIVGYSLDGFGIYGRHGIGGKVLASADLDVCHGHSHQIDWNGQRKNMYHYHATWDFPYTIGCMRGAYNMSNVRTIRGTPRRNTSPNLRPRMTDPSPNSDPSNSDRPRRQDEPTTLPTIAPSNSTPSN